MKTTRLFSTLILAVCLGCGTLMAQNAPQKVCPAKAGKGTCAKMTPEQRMDMQATRMGKQLMLDDAKLAQFTTLYKEYLTALKDCRPAPAEPSAEAVKPCERTDAQIQQDIEKRFEVRQKVLDTQKKYYNSFKKILNARQLEKVFSMNRPGKMHKRMGQKPCPMMQGRMGKPGQMPAPGCSNQCPEAPQAPQGK